MFRVLRSSAGAGKTHTLVKHYLALCLRDEQVAAYRHVIALTFTNKAAGEMKERVVAYLERLARRDLDAPVMRDVMDHLVRESGANEEVLAQRAARTLEHMLHHWGDAAITTIDAFTRRMVRPFARDLKLDHELRTTTEEEWYRDRAVEDVLAQAGTNAELTELLSETAHQLLEDSRRWDPGEPLRELSAELGMERSIGPLSGMEGQNAEAVVGTIEQLRASNARLRSALQQIGRQALERIERSGLTRDDFSYGKSGVHGFFVKLEGFGREWLAPNSHVLKTLEKDSWTKSAAPKDVQARVAGIAPELRSMLERAISLLSEQRAYFIRLAVLRDLPAAFALRALSHALEQRKRDDGVVFFSDLTRRVAELVSDEPASFIHERLGERYAHYLLDEFQDTSLLQWATLLPLVQNALASGGSALLVGDAKQAIYRWRNGEARLFLQLPRLFGRSDDPIDREREAALVMHNVPVDPLQENHRSAADIIAFNNALFAQLRDQLPEDLRLVYRDHDQLARRRDAGYVRMDRMAKELTGEDAAAHRRSFLLTCVQEAIDEGFAPGDIAVLVRDNASGQRAAAALTTVGHKVTSPDALVLGGDAMVETVIDLLRFLEDDDGPSAAVAMQRIGMLHAPAGTPLVDPYHTPTGVPEPLEAMRSWMLDQGIVGVRSTLTALIAQLLRALGIDPATDARALALLSEAHAFGTEHGPSVVDFLEHWDRTGHKRSLAPPPDMDAVQVLTVHKAKGLEFPVVIVPSTRMESRGSGDRIWLSSVQPETGLASALVKPNAILNDLDIPELDEERALQLLDALDLLYVAFTRPVQRLYALAHEYQPDMVTKGILNWMEQHGTDATWHTGERTGPWKRAAPSSAEALRPMAATDLPMALDIRSAAMREWDPADPERARRLGNAAHEVLSLMHDAGDLDRALRTIIDGSLLEPSEAEALRSQLIRLLDSRVLDPWFSGTAEVRNEAALIAADGKVLRPDRVVIDGDEARVLDYKTGSPSDAHANQVREYMRALRAVGYTRTQGALLYLGTGELITLEA